MKIVRIIARLNVGGPAQHVVWLSDRLRARGHETLLVVGSVPPGEQDMSQFAARHAVEPIVLREMSRELSPRDAVVVWKLFRLFRRQRPDVIHTHTAKAGTVGRVAALLYRWLTPTALIGRPRSVFVVHTYHGHVFHGYYSAARTGLFLAIERALARMATDRIVVVSPEQLAEINGVYRVGRREQFAVVRLGLDLDVFSRWEERRAAARELLDASDDRIVIGIVGRLTDIKDHALFLDAAAELLDLHGRLAGGVRFAVIGDGHLRDKLQERTRLLGIEPAVTFLGSREDMERVYPGFDIVALTSVNEGTPLTLIEALANARPVVAMDVGGVADIVGPPTEVESPAGTSARAHGVLVHQRSARTFADALDLLATRPALRRALGARGREHVMTAYALTRLANEVSELYASAGRPARNRRRGSPAPGPGSQQGSVT